MQIIDRVDRPSQFRDITNNTQNIIIIRYRLLHNFKIFTLLIEGSMVAGSHPFLMYIMNHRFD